MIPQNNIPPSHHVEVEGISPWGRQKLNQNAILPPPRRREHDISLRDNQRIEQNEQRIKQNGIPYPPRISDKLVPPFRIPQKQSKLFRFRYGIDMVSPFMATKESNKVAGPPRASALKWYLAKLIDSYNIR